MNAKNVAWAAILAVGALSATTAKAWDTMDPGADSRALTAAEAAAICGDTRGRTGVILGETEDGADLCEISIDDGESWVPLALAGGLGLLGAGAGVTYLIRRRKKNQSWTTQEEETSAATPSAVTQSIVAMPTQDAIVDIYRSDSRVDMNGDIIGMVTIGDETYDLSDWTIDDQNPGQYSHASGARIVFHMDGKIEYRLDGANADNNITISHANGAIERYDATGVGSVTFPNGDIVTEYTSYDGVSFINGVRRDASGNEVERYDAGAPAASAAVNAALGTPAAPAAPVAPPATTTVAHVSPAAAPQSAVVTTMIAQSVVLPDTLPSAQSTLDAVRKIKGLETVQDLASLGFSVATRDDGTDEQYIVAPDGLDISVSGEVALQKKYKVVGGKVVKKFLGLV